MSEYLIDSHCHIPLIEHENGVAGVINNALENGIGHMLVVAIDLETFPEVLKLAESQDCISASVGVHPNSRVDVEATVEQLCTHARNDKVVALGETGLDYYRSQGECEWQRERFRVHIRAAREVRKPLIIHSRNAGADVMRILAEEGADEVGGVMHCFAEDWHIACRAMELNFLISFSGIVTFKNALDLKDIARRVPLDRMLVETDAPYLAPVPYRGKQNQPAYTRYVAAHIAALREVDYDTVATATTANFKRLFTHARVAM